MGIVDESFSRLFPGTDFAFQAQVSYSGKFKPYNSTVRRIGNFLHFSLSRSWQNVSEEIVIGLIQHLLFKILRKERFLAAVMVNSRKISSLNMQLYDDFIKGISEVVVPNEASSDQKLESSFNRVNEIYFLNFMDRPQLMWGSDSFRKLASYDYHTNSVIVSSLFSEAPERLLDYLMYHELLHKKLKFSSSNGKTMHHNAEFRKLEANFEASKYVEDELNAFLRQKTGGRGRRSRRSRIATPVINWFDLLKLKL